MMRDETLDAGAQSASGSEPIGLTAAELLRLTRDCGADDRGLVSIDEPSLAEERPHVARAFPETRSLLALVIRMHREPVRSPARSVANLEFHRAGHEVDEVARRVAARSGPEPRPRGAIPATGTGARPRQRARRQGEAVRAIFPPPARALAPAWAARPAAVPGEGQDLRSASPSAAEAIFPPPARALAPAWAARPAAVPGEGQDLRPASPPAAEAIFPPPARALAPAWAARRAAAARAVGHLRWASGRMAGGVFPPAARPAFPASAARRTWGPGPQARSPPSWPRPARGADESMAGDSSSAEEASAVAGAPAAARPAASARGLWLRARKQEAPAGANPLASAQIDRG